MQEHRGFVAVIFVVSSGNGQDVIVTVSPTSLTAVQGTNQTFRCSYTLPQAAYYVRVKWMKDIDATDVTLWTAEGDLSIQQIKGNDAEPGFTNRLSGSPAVGFPAHQSEHSLTFLSVQVEDTGTYYCTVIYWEDPMDPTISSIKDSSTTTMNVQGESIKHTGKIYSHAFKKIHPITMQVKGSLCIQ